MGGSPGVQHDVVALRSDQLSCPSDWSISPLTEIARLETGHTPSRKHPEYWNGDIAWLSLNDVSGLSSKYVVDTVYRPTQLGIDNSSARLLPRNSVALCRTASVGKTCILGQEMATSQDFAVWLCGDQLHHEFLFYVFQGAEADFDRLKAGSTHKTIYMPAIRSFHIPLPPLPEQRRIAAILTSVDDAIQATQAVIDQTRRVKQGLLQELLTRGIGHTRFKQTEIGEVPEGWEVVRVDAVAEVRLGRQRSPKNRTGPYMRPYVRAANVKWSGWDLSEVLEMNFDPKEFETFRLVEGDILLGEASGSRSEVGKPAVWEGQVSDCCFQNTLIRVRPPSRLMTRFLFQRFVLDASSGAFAEAASGATLYHLGGGTMAAWKIGLPGEVECEQICDQLEGVDRSLACSEGVLQRIQDMKSGLMQDLLTGKVRVNVEADQ